MNSYQTTPIYFWAAEVFSHFCLCDLPTLQDFKEQEKHQHKRSQSKGDKTIDKHDFYHEAQKLCKMLSRHADSKKPFAYGKPKAQPRGSSAVSRRRSRFTGVTRNSVNFQTLVVISGKKTYVGSFSEELHAAIAFDFYSMLLRGLKGVTNFTYRAEEVGAMLDSFMARGQEFDPTEFAHIAQRMA